MTQHAAPDALVGAGVPPPRRAFPAAFSARAEAAAQFRKLQLATLLEHSPQAILILDTDGRVREWNPAAVALLGWHRAEVLGERLHRLVPSADRPALDLLWQDLRSGGEVRPLRTESLHRNGSRVLLDTFVVPILNENGSFEGVLVRLVPVASRGTDTVAPSARTATSAPHSSSWEPPRSALASGSPNGLPGRRWLQWRLATPIPVGEKRAVALLDVDAFALVNQGYGPEVGDDLLHVLGTRFAEVAGTAELGRWQADEFVCIIDAPDAGTALDELVARLLVTATQPILVGRDQVRMTVSAGLVTSERVSLPELFRSASIALDSAKSRGRDRAVWFDDADAIPHDASGLRLANDLQRGIAAGELRLHFQPIQDLATDEVVGVEALVRWERPGVGLLSPGSFIDVAERTGQIVSLGEWVVRHACEAAVRLAGQRSAPLRVSINVSARQLSDPGLVRMLRETLARTGCDARNIGIEVTETAVLHDIAAAAMVLEDIKSLGVHLDLDDFGTGYSSLLYLKHFPVDRIKIDMSFIAGLGRNIADTAIVASTIALAHSVGLAAIAEGVETPTQLRMLKQLGCDFAQGYLLSRPLPQCQLETWLQQDTCVAPRPPTTGEVADVAKLSRERVAHQREILCDRRDGIADDREDAGDRRDLGADHRDQAGDDRDLASDLRDVKADDRDRLADERERVADRRDATATRHLREVPDSPQIGTSTATLVPSHLSARARQEAAADRLLAVHGRGVEADVRRQADVDRDAASTERDAGADERVHASRDRSRAQDSRIASAHDRRAVLAHGCTADLDDDTAIPKPRDGEAHGGALSGASVVLGEEDDVA